VTARTEPAPSASPTPAGSGATHRPDGAAGADNALSTDIAARYGEGRVRLPPAGVADREATLAPETWRLAAQEGRLRRHGAPGRPHTRPDAPWRNRQP
jgi:hypothetical protein